MPSPSELLSLLRHVGGRLDGDVSLDALAGRAGWSPFHLHRAFRRLVGETPKAYTQRLRLDRAAARLAAGTDRVVDMALDSGFASHEVFTRAFTRRFGRSPERYRAAARSSATADGARAPCRDHRGGRPVPHAVSPVARHQEESVMSTPHRRAQGAAAAARARRQAPHRARRDSRHHCRGLGKTYSRTRCRTALPSLAGRPSPLLRRRAGPDDDRSRARRSRPPAAGVGDIEAITLPGGPAAVAVHMGPYDTLQETYAAIERWMEQQGVRAGGSPWESYITDPAEHPGPGQLAHRRLLADQRVRVAAGLRRRLTARSSSEGWCRPAAGRGPCRKSAESGGRRSSRPRRCCRGRPRQSRAAR